jgi:hypothetical protein
MRPPAWPTLVTAPTGESGREEADMRPRSLAGVAALAAGATAALLAGPLDPPDGPVAPTHKTLTQVEPRTPIDQSRVPVLIAERGSYYLTEDLQPVGFNDPVVSIVADDVTLDLNGFTIIGASEVGQATAGIEISDNDNVVIRNGTVKECFGHGVTGSGNLDTVVSIERLQILNNAGTGIYFPSGYARVIDCTAFSNGESGIFCYAILAHGCVATFNGIDEGAGIGAITGLIQSCVAVNNHDDDIIGFDVTLADNYSPE